MKQIFVQYKGLRKEVYLLLIGRVIAAIGRLVAMMMTLILKSKLGFSSVEIANVLLYMGLLNIPGLYISGRLADRFNKRNLIVLFSLGASLSMLFCSIIPLSKTTVVFCVIESLFSQMQVPCFDALMSDLSKSEDRERVFGLGYLGGNLGGALSPFFGGLLFANHINLVFLINAISALLGAMVLLFFIKDITPTKGSGELTESYQKAESSEASVLDILKQRKMLVWYFISFVAGGLLYSQLFFLLPLNFEQLYQESGAFYFGSVMMLNASIVIIGMPIFSVWLKKIEETKKMLWGQVLIAVSLSSYIFIQGIIPAYFLVMIFFTFGEILNSMAQRPYLTKRIPATHRGRIISFTIIVTQIAEPLFQQLMGFLLDEYNLLICWYVVAVVGFVVIMIYLFINRYDKKFYPFLYSKQ